MSDINSCVVKGRLAADPEVDYLPSGTAKVRFRIANSRWRKDAEKTNWITVVAFGKRAETIGEYFSKGSEIIVQGELTVDQWETKEGENRTSVYIMLSDFSFTNGNNKSEGSGGKSSKGKGKKSGKKTDNMDDDYWGGDFEFDEDEEEEKPKKPAKGKAKPKKPAKKQEEEDEEEEDEEDDDGWLD